MHVYSSASSAPLARVVNLHWSLSKCASVSQTFHRHPALPAHQDHLKTPQSTVMDILQPKAANNLQWQRKEQRDCDTSGHLTPSLNYQEPTSIISSLVHDLLDLRQEVNELKLQVTESYRELTTRSAREGTERM
ncbi:hypothetical protein G5714_022716 [Onychostoma macrolepis]|uniref:Uncharacterized protein n=1 Tax=Onychostoma macrolepis TaxID=369639 RepID=A0A7J6BNY5_9TELE|nr:hypothetical protein G5714_022716 [Onychostoma macrolepis]